MLSETKSKKGVLEKLGLATHTKYNVKQNQVYRPDEYFLGGFYSVTTRPGIHVINGEVGPNGSDESPVPEVYYDRLQLTNKGKAVMIGLWGIATSLIVYFLK